ncbi:unknown protein [Grouper iridovirus]|uniref:Insulin-like domain-containing protein n=1 Tax=Grouper iridovirus TaxID=127569 RepID=Q5GAI4_9VIRU|nr:unknown protein [Grouper iridovirus]
MLFKLMLIVFMTATIKETYQLQVCGGELIDALTEHCGDRGVYTPSRRGRRNRSVGLADACCKNECNENELDRYCNPKKPTVAPSTVAPSTVAPSTVAPSTVAPSTVAPSTVAPSTVAPSTVAPSTVAPSTVAPSTVAPSTVAPSTVAPSTVAPSTVAPSTVAPSTVAPSTVAPEMDVSFGMTDDITQEPSSPHATQEPSSPHATQEPSCMYDETTEKSLTSSPAATHESPETTPDPIEQAEREGKMIQTILSKLLRRLLKMRST